MTEYTWGDLRDKAIQAYGDAPGAELEQRILDVWRHHPQIVAALIDAVAARVAAGKVRSGWAILDTEVQRATTTSDEKATDTSDRTKAIAHTKQRIRTEHLHYDRPSEVEDSLFGDMRHNPVTDKDNRPLEGSRQGPLRPWADDEKLRASILKQWVEVRPQGELIERQAQERGDRYIAHQRQMDELAAAKKAQLDQAQATIADDDPLPF